MKKRSLITFSRAYESTLKNQHITLVPVREYGRHRELGFDACVEFDVTLAQEKTKIGEIALRLGESPQMYYLGHIGYHIDPPYRGHGYASTACGLLLPLVKALGMASLVVTADPENEASRKTVEKLGGILESIVPVPLMYQIELMISQKKCRYIVLLT